MKNAFALALACLLIGCSKPDKTGHVQAAKLPEAIPVRTSAAAVRHIDRTIFVTGSLNPDESVTVSSEVQGRVSRILADFGQNVRKGQVLVELDKQEYQIQLERAKAALAQALARIGLSPGQEDSPPESTAGMRQATAQLEDAKFKYESAQRLVKSGDISQEHFTELEKAYRAREAAYEGSRDELRTQWANMESLRADVKLAQKRLNDATVRAPFDGAVTQKLVSPGQYTKENTSLLTVVKVTPLRLRVEIPESAAAEVRIGSLLSFATSAVPGREFHAVVRELNPALDAKSRSLTVEARLAESDVRLRPGMFVQVRLITSRGAEVVVVPKQAVYSLAGMTKIFVIRNGRAVEQRVPAGQEYEGWMEVPRDQVQSGEPVAVSNLPLLVNGAQVKRNGA